MKRMYLLLLCLLINILIIGCIEDDNQSAKVGNLILNQEQIKTVKVVKGSNEEIMTALNPSDILTLIDKVKEISVKKLSRDQDNNFMPERIVEETKLNIYFYGENNTELYGEFFIWPDGFIYVVDVNTMQANQRTISYLSESKYPEIYKWLNERI